MPSSPSSPLPPKGPTPTRPPPPPLVLGGAALHESGAAAAPSIAFFFACCCAGTSAAADVAAATRDALIARSSLDEATRDHDRVRLLLLGAGESGKSTVFKQMRLLYGHGYSEVDRRALTAAVRSNILAALRDLLALVEDLNIPLARVAELGPTLPLAGVAAAAGAAAGAATPALSPRHLSLQPAEAEQPLPPAASAAAPDLAKVSPGAAPLEPSAPPVPIQPDAFGSSAVLPSSSSASANAGAGADSAQLYSDDAAAGEGSLPDRLHEEEEEASATDVDPYTGLGRASTDTAAQRPPAAAGSAARGAEQLRALVDGAAVAMAAAASSAALDSAAAAAAADAASAEAEAVAGENFGGGDGNAARRRNEVATVLAAAMKTAAAASAAATAAANASAASFLKIDARLADLIDVILRDPALQDVLSRRDTAGMLSDTARHFLGRVRAVGRDDYVPSIEDVLKCRVRTTGVVEELFDAGDVAFTVIDVGGQKSERRKWIHAFDNVNAMIFVVSLGDYDQTMAEDPHTNRLADSLRLFEEMANNRLFARASIVLFFNKRDLFADKIRRTDLRQPNPDPRLAATEPTLFADYTGGCNEDLALKYIVRLFLSRRRAPAPGAAPLAPIFWRATCALDTGSFVVVLNAVKELVLQSTLSL